VHAVESRLLEQLGDRQDAQLERVRMLISSGVPVTPDLLAGVAGPAGYVAVLDRSGNELAASDPHAGIVYSNVALPAPEAGTGAAGGGVGTDVLFVTNVPYEFTVRTESIATPTGELTALTASSLDEIEASVATLRRLLWIAVPALAAAVGAATWWLVSRTLRPVDAICAEVDAITARTITRRVPEPATDDEIRHLARTMNAMLHRLDEAQARQRRFVSDASHELRSPVAVARTNLEVALAHPEGADWPAVATTVLDETARLDRLVAELLDLARLEEDSRPWEPVDLEEVVLAEAGRFPTSRSPEVRADAVSAGRVLGDRRLLARLVRNLFDNAVRHARTHVTVSLAGDGADVVLAVEDDGAGIADEADRERVFERFTRLADGRARDGGGAGLGLALVRRIAEQHGGRVHAETAAAGGARFVVELPALS
jgi:signal transduction histidine kinase